VVEVVENHGNCYPEQVDDKVANSRLVKQQELFEFVLFPFVAKIAEFTEVDRLLKALFYDFGYIAQKLKRELFVVAVAHLVQWKNADFIFPTLVRFVFLLEDLVVVNLFHARIGCDSPRLVFVLSLHLWSIPTFVYLLFVQFLEDDLAHGHLEHGLHHSAIRLGLLLLHLQPYHQVPLSEPQRVNWLHEVLDRFKSESAFHLVFVEHLEGLLIVALEVFVRVPLLLLWVESL